MFTKNKIFYTNFSKNRNFNDSSEDFTFEEQSGNEYIVPENWRLNGFWPKSSINWNKEGFRTGVIDRVFPSFLKEIEKKLRYSKGGEINKYQTVDEDSFEKEYPFTSRPFSDIENLVDKNLKSVKTWKPGFVGRKFKPTLIPSDDGFGLVGLRKAVEKNGEELIEGYFYPGFMANMSPEWRSHLESVYGKDYVSDLEKSYAEDIAKTYFEKRNQVPFSPNSPKMDAFYSKDVYDTFERRNKNNQKFLDRQKAIDELKYNPNLVYNPEWRKRADYVLSDDETYNELFSNEEVYDRAMHMNGDREDWEKFSNSVLSARASKKQDQKESVATNPSNKQQEKPILTTNFPIPFHKKTVDNDGIPLNETSETRSQGGIENAKAETKNVAVNNSFITNFPRKILITNFSKSKKDKKKRLEELLMERSIGEVGEGYGSKNPYLADVLAVGVAPAIANKIVSTKKELSKYDKLAENDAIVSQSAKSAGLLGLIGAGAGAIGGGIIGWKNNPNINDAMFGAQIGAMGVGGLGALLGGVHGALKGKKIAKKRRDEEKRLILKALEE